MFFIISKIFGQLLVPSGMLLVLLMLIYLYRKNHTKVKRLTLFTIFLTYCFSSQWFLNSLCSWWELPLVSLEKVEAQSYGVVLTGGLMDEDFSEGKNLHLGRSGDRLWQMLYLYQSGKVKRIVISGGDVGLLKSSVFSESMAARSFLIQNGVPETQVFVENSSKNTYENALFTAQMIKGKGWAKKGILVSSAFHLKRATACFRKQGLIMVPFASSFLKRKSSTEVYNFIPSADAFSKNELIIKEMMGYFIYKMMNYL